VRIAINTRFLLSDKMEGFGWYSYEITKRIVEAHPEHQFYFFFDRTFDPKFIFAANVTPIVLRPAARHPILYLWWFEMLVTKALKKHKIDLFFSPDGYLSLRTSIPQIATIHDINFEHHPEDLPFFARTYLRFFFRHFALKASHLLTVSTYSKMDICKTYGITDNKITVTLNGVSDHYVPLSIDEVELIRTRYTDGHPYFLFVGSIHPRKNLRRLLDAFKKFKKTYESPIKMVIVGSEMWRSKNHRLDWEKDLESELIFTGHVEQKELVKIMGAAYALTYVPYYEGFGMPLVEAMKCGVPIISGDQTSLPEVAGNAALYCNPFDTDAICSAMIQIVTNSERYDDLKRKALLRGSEFSWDNSADKVWHVLKTYLPIQK
jgi:glycosyltransferase involved in cell wall biosynthesis